MSGQEVTGLLSAASETDVVSTLSTRQLFPIQIQLAESAQKQALLRGRRVRSRDLSIFFAQLSDLLRSGVPLLRSLELLEKQTRSQAFKVVLQDVREEVSEGTRLAEAMKKHQGAFSELAISMVRAGEEGSFLEDVLRRIADFTDHQEDLKSRVTGAMAYPFFLVLFGVGIVTAMMVWFVPKFDPIFRRMAERDSLPWATTVVQNLSQLIAGYWWVLLAAIGAGAVFAVRYAATEDGRFFFDKVRLKIPGAGRIYRSLAIARFCRILGTLLKNGVPILNSLRIAKDATGNRVLSTAIAGAGDNISSGKTLAQPLAACGEFPEETVEMISVAEEANNLEQVLVDIADGMERRTWRYLELFIRLLEPVMLVAMAAVVMFVLLGLLLPVLQSSSVLSG